jgi:P63C domain
MKALTKATHQAPLEIGKWAITAYVLGTDPVVRIISKSDTATILSAPISTKFERAIARLRRHPAIKGHAFVSATFDLAQPFEFQKRDGQPQKGYDSEGIVEMCRFILKAREFGLLASQYESAIAQAAESFIVSIAKVGLAALIDEATGFQRDRDREALRKLLDTYLKKEHAAWAKKFPDEFYVEMFRLRGWTWKGMQVNRPSIVGTYTRDIVYARMAPGIVQELERLNPKATTGNRRSKHHQFMTDDIGHPALNNHLQGVLAIMRASDTWRGFNRLIKKAYPRYGDQMDLLDLIDSDLD